jgi:hypothetical protein
MEIGKLGIFIIAIAFIIVIVTAAALAYPPFKDGLYWFGVEVLGANIIGAIAAANTTIYTFAAGGIAQGVGVALLIVVITVILWTLVLKRGYNKLREKFGTAPTPTTTGPTYTTPTPVIIRETPVPVSEPEKKSE